MTLGRSRLLLALPRARWQRRAASWEINEPSDSYQGPFVLLVSCDMFR
jgi:hypothetical protein